jgi:hypothetical protein
MPGIHKGDRYPITCRVPTYARDHLMRLAQDLRISLGDFVGYKVLLGEGFDISTEALRAAPQLIRMYDPEQWAKVIDAQPDDVAERIRRQLPEVYPPNEQLAMTG